MIGAGIYPGDLVIVDRYIEAEPGPIVIAAMSWLPRPNVLLEMVARWCSSPRVRVPRPAIYLRRGTSGMECRDYSVCSHEKPERVFALIDCSSFWGSVRGVSARPPWKSGRRNRNHDLRGSRY